MSLKFKATSPCNNCPYRKDAPLQHWVKEEFKDLLKNETDFMGTVYACHKKNGCVCTGWLMMQDKNNFPSIALRIKLSKDRVNRGYLDSLYCESEMYDSVQEMAKANYNDL